MYVFYTPDIEGMTYTMNVEESKHCVRVLRLEEGDQVVLVDGRGGWYESVIEVAESRGCRIKCLIKRENYGCRPFHFHLAVTPTKNMGRMEWLLEKCTEMGIEEVTMLRTRHSERKDANGERLKKVVVAAMKQSLKAYMPQLNDMVDFKDFIMKCQEKNRFIAHCYEGEKKHMSEVCRAGEDVVILIGPEGDFSKEEVAMAEAAGFISVSLGDSRLRTETAGLVACHGVNFINKC